MKGLFITLQVIHALVLRETRTRFGTHKLGYLWALIEPSVGIGIFAGMFYLMGRGAPAGMDVVSMLGTGMLPYQLFNGTSSRTSSAIESNRGLLYYPQVRPLDLVVARALLETITMVVVFGIIMGAHGFYVQSFEFENLLLVLLGIGLAASLGTARGLVMCSVATFWPTAGKIEDFLMRPMFWVSGIFFTANELPGPVRELFLYNPLLHAIELVRDGWFYGYTARHASISYPLWFILTLTVLGLLLERPARRHQAEVV